jgi:hypothetical protein
MLDEHAAAIRAELFHGDQKVAVISRGEIGEGLTAR